MSETTTNPEAQRQAQSTETRGLYDELLDVSLGEVMEHAAKAQGDPKTEIDHTVDEHRSWAVNRSGEAVMVQTGFGNVMPMDEGERHFRRDTARTPEEDMGLGGESSMTVTLTQNYVEVFPSADNRELILETRTPDGKNVWYRLYVENARDGEHIKPVPKETKTVDGKVVYAGRTISIGREIALKRLIADKYGLKYRLAEPREFRFKRGQAAEYDMSTVDYVTNLIYELRQQGLRGKELRKKAGELLTPDAEGNGTEALSYFKALDLSGI